MREVKKINKLDKRNTAMDIIRIVAVFFVVSIHFFLNSGYYYENNTGTEMYIMCTMRTLFTSCIPLFLLLTGYLMSKKTLCKQYYSGIVRILLIYLMSGIACVVYNVKFLHSELDIKKTILSVFNFTMAPYGWYIEMYIGLFLLIPFLNILYNAIETQKKKKILLVTIFAVSILPSLFNQFSFESQLWYNPDANVAITKLFPNWWTTLYPMAYYFIGCYVREYGLKIKNTTALIFLVIATVAFGAFNFFRSYNTVFEGVDYVNWQGIQPFVIAVLIFVLLSRIKANKMPQWSRFVLWKISDAALGIYLVSYIFDVVAYQRLINSVPVMTDRFRYFIVVVAFIFACSMGLSLVFNIILKGMSIVSEQIKGIFAVFKAEPEETEEVKKSDSNKKVSEVKK